MPRRTSHSRRLRLVRRALALGLACTVVAAGAVWSDAAGAGRTWQRVLDHVDRFIAGPVPDRSIPPLMVVTPRPTEMPTAVPSGEPVATPAPTAVRLPMDVQIDPDPAGHFAHEIRNTWCSPAGVEMTLAVLDLHAVSSTFQREIAGRVHEWESSADSHNGGWGPQAMAWPWRRTCSGLPGACLRHTSRRTQRCGGRDLDDR